MPKGSSGPPMELWRPASDKMQLRKPSSGRELGPWASSWAALENEKDTTPTAIKVGGQYITVLFGPQLPLTRKRYNKMRGTYFSNEDFARPLSLCRCDTFCMNLHMSIQQEYLRRTRKLLETKLSSRNLIKGINTWALPLVRYSRPFLRRIRDELKRMDQRTRKLMTMHKALHPRDDVDRLYVSRKEGGWGLASIEDSVDASIQRLEDYVDKNMKDDSLQPLETILIIRWTTEWQ